MVDKRNLQSSSNKRKSANPHDKGAQGPTAFWILSTIAVFALHKHVIVFVVNVLSLIVNASLLLIVGEVVQVLQVGFFSCTRLKFFTI